MNKLQHLVWGWEIGLTLNVANANISFMHFFFQNYKNAPQSLIQWTLYKYNRQGLIFDGTAHIINIGDGSFGEEKM